MEGFLPILFLLVVLKIPVFGALWLVWWASKAPEADGSAEDSGGGFGRWRPLPTRPRGPHHHPGDGARASRRARGYPPGSGAGAVRRGRGHPVPSPYAARAARLRSRRT